MVKKTTPKKTTGGAPVAPSRPLVTVPPAGNLGEGGRKKVNAQMKIFEHDLRKLVLTTLAAANEEHRMAILVAMTDYCDPYVFLDMYTRRFGVKHSRMEIYYTFESPA